MRCTCTDAAVIAKYLQAKVDKRKEIKTNQVDKSLKKK